MQPGLQEDCGQEPELRSEASSLSHSRKHQRFVKLACRGAMTPMTVVFHRLALQWILSILLAHCLLAADVPRPEHPRPDMVRADWQSLNGPWEFEFDDADKGQAERWHAGNRKLSKKILVPYCFQSKLSGIADPAF